jgi:hypothetical protein
MENTEVAIFIVQKEIFTERFLADYDARNGIHISLPPPPPFGATALIWA